MIGLCLKIMARKGTICVSPFQTSLQVAAEVDCGRQYRIGRNSTAEVAGWLGNVGYVHANYSQLALCVT